MQHCRCHRAGSEATQEQEVACLGGYGISLTGQSVSAFPCSLCSLYRDLSSYLRPTVRTSRRFLIARQSSVALPLPIGSVPTQALSQDVLVHGTS